MVRVFYSRRSQGAGRVNTDNPSVVSMDSSITTVITEDAPPPLMATMILATIEDESDGTPERGNFSPVVSFSDNGDPEDEPGHIAPRATHGVFRRDRSLSTSHRSTSYTTQDEGELADDEAEASGYNNAPKDAPKGGALDFVLRPCPNSPKQLEESLDGSLRTVDRVIRASSSWIDCTRRNDDSDDDPMFDLEAPDDELKLYAEQQRQKKREQKNVILQVIDDPWLDHNPCSPNGSNYRAPSLPVGHEHYTNRADAYYDDDGGEGSSDGFGIQPTNSWLEYMGISARRQSEDHSTEDDGIQAFLKPSFSWIRMRADDCEQSSTPIAPNPPISLPIKEEEGNRAIGQEIYQAIRNVRLRAPSLLSHSSSTTPAVKVPPLVEADMISSDESTIGTGPFEVQDMAIYVALEQMATQRDSVESNSEVNDIDTNETYDIENSSHGEEDDSEESGNGTYEDEQFELALVPDGDLEKEVNGDSDSPRLESAASSALGSTELEGNSEQTARNDVMLAKLDDDKGLELDECNAKSQATDDGQVTVPIEKEALELSIASKEAESEGQVGAEETSLKQQQAKEGPGLQLQEAWQVQVEQQMEDIEQQLQYLEQNEAEEEQLQQRQMMTQNRTEPQPQPVLLSQRAMAVDPPSSADFEAQNNSNDCFDSCGRLGSFLSSMLPARDQILSTHTVKSEENHDLELEEGHLFSARSEIDNDTDASSALQPRTNCSLLSPLPLSRRPVPKKHVTFQIDPSAIDSGSSGSSCTDEENFSDMESSTNVSSVKTPAEEDKSSQAAALSDGDGEHPGLLDRMFEAIETSEERHLQWLNEVLSTTSSRSTESSLTNDPAIEAKSTTAAKAKFGFNKITAKFRERKPVVEQPHPSNKRNGTARHCRSTCINKNTGNARHRRSTDILLVALACMVAVLVVSVLAFKNQQDEANASSQKSSAISAIETDDGGSGGSRTFPAFIPSEDPSDSPTD